jgi:hypothetical protein
VKGGGGRLFGLIDVRIMGNQFMFNLSVQFV